MAVGDVVITKRSLAKTVFSVRALWSIVLLLNAVYALVSLAVSAITAAQM